MKKNTGKAFEKLAESIFNKLVVNQKYEKVQHNVHLEGADGPRQIDVLITSETVGIKLHTVIECKDYNTKISVGTIDAFHSKLQDVNANKGILISKKGFSSTSVSKAKRLGISLCTAHEALSESWQPDLDINILIEEIKPISINVNYTGFFQPGDKLVSNKIPVVNGLEIHKLIENEWRKCSINFIRTEKEQKIELDGLKKPYVIKTLNENSQERLLDSLDIFIKLNIRCFETKLSELKGTQVLKNISEGKTTVFIEVPSIQDLENKLVEVKSNVRKEFTGIILTTLVTPQIQSTIDKMKIDKL